MSKRLIVNLICLIFKKKLNKSKITSYLTLVFLYNSWRDLIMLNITNITASQFIQRNISDQIKQITESTERLSSGKRINNASDSPGSIGPISRLNSQILSISLLNTFLSFPEYLS